MSNLIYWLDAQITFANEQERRLEEMGKHEDALFWRGRSQALWDVKRRMEDV